MPLEDQELQERVAKMETLLEEVEALEDPHARAKAAEVVGLLLDLYGDGLARMMEEVARGEDRQRAFEAFTQDELVSHLLLLHGLHPLDLEERVLGALEEVRPYLGSHGGDVELLGIEGGVARLRLQGSCDGCPSSAVTLKLAIEEAIQKAAPELEGVEAEGVSEPEPAPTLVAGPTLRRKKKKPQEGEDSGNGASANGSSWTTVGDPGLSSAGLALREIEGDPALFVKTGDDLYAYRDPCPGCGESLEQGILSGDELNCPGCGRRYDVRRAGACPDDSRLHLEPIPLLVGEGGAVKIARPSAVG